MTNRLDDWLSLYNQLTDGEKTQLIIIAHQRLAAPPKRKINPHLLRLLSLAGSSWAAAVYMLDLIRPGMPTPAIATFGLAALVASLITTLGYIAAPLFKTIRI